LKKILSIIIVGILALGGLGAVAVNEEKIETDIMTFSSLTIMDRNSDYVELHLNEASSYLMQPGKPMVPKVVKTVELPFGVQNVEVKVLPIGINEVEIENKISPAPALLPLTSSNNIDVKTEKSEKTYESTDLFPNSWFSHSVGCGLNGDGERVTHVAIHIFPVRYAPALDKLCVAESAKVSITYEEPKTNPFSLNSEYDLVIIAPSKFTDDLQRLIDHKNSLEVNTILKTTEDIYNEYTGVDKPEQIKYFIKDAIETWDITYVLLVGGLNSVVYAKPRDDANQGSKDWYVPVRYTNLYDDPAFPLAADTIHDPGTISDLYYSDIYREGGVFADWDPNNDGIFDAWGKPGYENDTNLDYYPDVSVGRLACRSATEVKTVVDKIINYESNPIDPSWFKKMIVISGDGFLDQIDWNMKWDTNSLESGEYIIHAQSKNPEDVIGPEDTITITIDRGGECVQSSIHFNHDDHLNPALENGYPAVPIAEIVSISNGDILSSSDYSYTPSDGEAYLNWFFWWANVSYVDGVLTIRGKSYDPKPSGYLTDLHVWITNSNDEIVFSDWRNNSEMYYEGEWVTGEKLLNGRGGALYYMPEDFEKDILWASNGRLTGQTSVIDAIDKGSGFLFFSGHGSPNVWADQYPGIPGNRAGGSVTGLQVTTLRPWPPFVTLPAFPMDTISNGEKLPIAVVGGCHNSQFNVSMILGVMDIMHYFFPAFPELSMWCHGTPVPETFSWRLIRNPNGGAIASMGNTGLGYGVPNKEATTGGGDAWITIEFFKQYGTEGHDILGETYSQTLTSYVNTFDMGDLQSGHPKTVEQWVLLGDPSLKIGGYS